MPSRIHWPSRERRSAEAPFETAISAAEVLHRSFRQEHAELAFLGYGVYGGVLVGVISGSTCMEIGTGGMCSRKNPTSRRR